MSLTKIESPIAPLPHKTYPSFSYSLFPLPKYLLVFPIFPAPYIVSVTPLDNHFQKQERSP